MLTCLCRYVCKSVCVYMCRGLSWWWVSSLLTPHLIDHGRFCWTWSLLILASITSQLVPATSVSASRVLRLREAAMPAQNLHGCWASELQSSCLCGKYFVPSHLASPVLLPSYWDRYDERPVQTTSPPTPLNLRQTVLKLEIILLLRLLECRDYL